MFIWILVSVAGGLVGVLMTVLGQLIIKILIEPAQELRKEIGNVRFVLVRHEQAIHTPASRNCHTSNAAFDGLYDCVAGLLARIQGMNLNWFTRCCWRFPPKPDIEGAVRHLRSLTSYVFQKSMKLDEHESVRNHVKCIENLLNLDPLEKEEPLHGEDAVHDPSSN